jgi:hypothetical protein
MNLTTLLVHRRNRSLRPNAAAAWALLASLGGAPAPSAGDTASLPSHGLTSQAAAPGGAILHEP